MAVFTIHLFQFTKMQPSDLTLDRDFDIRLVVYRSNIVRLVFRLRKVYRNAHIPSEEDSTDLTILYLLQMSEAVHQNMVEQTMADMIYLVENEQHFKVEALNF